jgi:hypothetical protein
MFLKIKKIFYFFIFIKKNNPHFVVDKRLIYRTLDTMRFAPMNLPQKRKVLIFVNLGKQEMIHGSLNIKIFQKICEKYVVPTIDKI